MWGAFYAHWPRLAIASPGRNCRATGGNGSVQVGVGFVGILTRKTIQV